MVLPASPWRKLARPMASGSAHKLAGSYPLAPPILRAAHRIKRKSPQYLSDLRLDATHTTRSLSGVMTCRLVSLLACELWTNTWNKLGSIIDNIHVPPFPDGLRSARTREQLMYVDAPYSNISYQGVVVGPG